MKVYALLSWFDEQPQHLTRCIQSLQGFADHLIAVDGPYATYPHTDKRSPIDNYLAIREVGIGGMIHDGRVWPSEVAKRAFMFTAARAAGATPDDWLLIIDGDTSITTVGNARALLEATTLDVADIHMQNTGATPVVCRSLYRAIPGLTVERCHWLYTAPGSPRRYMWHTPDGNVSSEPALDLTGEMLLHHHIGERTPERTARADRYYHDRDHGLKLENAGDWL